MVKTVKISFFTFRSDIEPLKVDKHKSGILHSFKFDNGREEHAFAWLHDKNHKSVRKVVLHFSEFGFAESQMCFIPFSTKDNWLRRYPHACPYMECNKHGTIKGMPFFQDIKSGKGSGSATEQAITRITNEGPSDNNASNSSSSRPTKRQKRSNNKKGPKIIPSATLFDSERSLLHIEIYNYFCWLQTELNALEGGTMRVQTAGMSLPGIQNLITKLERTFRSIGKLKSINDEMRKNKNREEIAKNAEGVNVNGGGGVSTNANDNDGGEATNLLNFANGDNNSDSEEENDDPHPLPMLEEQLEENLSRVVEEAQRIEKAQRIKEAQKVQEEHRREAARIRKEHNHRKNDNNAPEAASNALEAASNASDTDFGGPETAFETDFDAPETASDAPETASNAPGTSSNAPDTASIKGSKCDFEVKFDSLVAYKQEKGNFVINYNYKYGDVLLGRWVTAIRRRKTELRKEGIECEPPIENEDKNESDFVTLPISPGRLGLTLQFYKTGLGAMITGVDSACTFKDQVNVGDRLITVDGSVVSKVEDLSSGKEAVRMFGIAKKMAYASTYLSMERVERLESIGFEWAFQPLRPKRTWDEWLELLVQYKETHGKWPVRREKWEKIGDWIHEQRRRYTQKNKNFMANRAPKLEEIGFPLVLRKASQNVRWEDQVQMLVEFRKCFLF
mmetsp:Transcript_21126/g.38756  ORF Transcript_21126/g.38756 Transcript_21126/m.38756 type:complete len:677 (+) Transcript_21126:72-2102(+)